MITASDSPSLSGLVRGWAERTPDAIVIAAPGRPPLTYGALWRQIEATVARLNTLGLGRGDRVALALPNGPEMAVAFLAVTAGAVCAPLNPDYRVDEFTAYLTGLRARAVIVASGHTTEAPAAARALAIPVLELTPVGGREAGIFSVSGEQNGAAVAGGLAAGDDVGLLLHTSGASARPKLVPLTHRNMSAAAESYRRALGLTASDRCLNVMPLFHVHGLYGALLPSVLAGASIVCAPGFDGPAFFDWLRTFRPTWYTAVPTIHQAVLAWALRYRHVIAECPLRLIRSGSAPLAPQLAAELQAAFQAPVVENYGLTEAAPITYTPLPPGRSKPGSVGLAAGVDLAIVDEAGQPLPAGATGEVVVRGASVMSGYDGDAAANTDAFVNGWFRTGDLGQLDADGFLFLTGRIKEIIKRGGQQVAPREVDEVLLEHPGVAEATTFAVPHSSLGEDVAAVVVLRPQASVSEAELRAFVAARLADFKVPRQLLFVPALPKNAAGKVQRIGMAARLGLVVGEPSPPLTGPALPGSEVERALGQLWCQILRVDHARLDEDFFAAGGDSLRASALVAGVCESLDVDIPLAQFLRAPTLAGLVAAVTEQRQQRAGP